MKKVAGRLRLDLAQYRELAVFAQFGSDLDEATKKQLDRGARLTEILKQDQYEPLPVAEQVAIIFAGVNGYLDDIPLPEVKRFEKDFLAFLRTKHAEILATISTDIPKETEETLRRLLTSFKEQRK
jgi:F-type H+-transporting ATPase subunit alpha